MYLGIDPANLGRTLLQIHKVSDEIWYQAGDRSLDVMKFILFINIYNSIPGTQKEPYFQLYLCLLSFS